MDISSLPKNPLSTPSLPGRQADRQAGRQAGGGIVIILDCRREGGGRKIPACALCPVPWSSLIVTIKHQEFRLSLLLTLSLSLIRDYTKVRGRRERERE